MRHLKKESAKIIALNVAVTSIFITVLLFITVIQHKNYNRIINTTLNSVINSVITEYPNVSEEEILKILEGGNNSEKSFLSQYGYDDEMMLIDGYRDAMRRNMIINSSFLAMFCLTLLFIYFWYNKKSERKLMEISRYIKAVNNKEYELNIKDNGEDELSKLRNELYKITVSLRETAENSVKEKERLSNSITDISHQLKTPLTSIRIMLDNIEDNPEMDKETKQEFLHDISKQIDWMSSLVISLLKLAKFDAGVIALNSETIILEELVNNVLDNLAVLIDIKNIEVVTKIPDDSTFLGDYKWELEAFSNIIKNAIEHSYDDGKIYICAESNSLFLKVEIKDEGKGINKNELKHIFERFYKSKNSNENSIGVGLSLAKIIIEKDNGYISVDSEENKGTCFEIKYMR